MIDWVESKISIKQFRTFFLVLAIVFNLGSYLLFFQTREDGNFIPSDFLDLFGLLALIPAFNYKLEEKPLKIHTEIEKRINKNSVKVFSLLALVFTILTLIGIYLSYKNYSQLGYVSHTNFGFLKILLFLLWFTFSFWERRQVLKKEEVSLS